MRRLLLIAMSVTLFSTAVYTPKANAAIGFIAKSKVVKTVGGVTSATGGVVGTVSIISLATTGNLGTAILGALGFYVGVMTAGIGLIILEDKTIAELSFDKVYLNEFDVLSEEDVTIYNRELQMLNSIKETISQELPDNTTLKESGEAWKAYSGMLSPETMKVASKVSEKFLSQK